MSACGEVFAGIACDIQAGHGGSHSGIDSEGHRRWEHMLNRSITFTGLVADWEHRATVHTLAPGDDVMRSTVASCAAELRALLDDYVWCPECGLAPIRDGNTSLCAGCAEYDPYDGPYYGPDDDDPAPVPVEEPPADDGALKLAMGALGDTLRTLRWLMAEAARNLPHDPATALDVIGQTIDGMEMHDAPEVMESFAAAHERVRSDMTFTSDVRCSDGTVHYRGIRAGDDPAGWLRRAEVIDKCPRSPHRIVRVIEAFTPAPSPGIEAEPGPT